MWPAFGITASREPEIRSCMAWAAAGRCFQQRLDRQPKSRVGTWILGKMGVVSVRVAKAISVPVTPSGGLAKIVFRI